jgi:hypothetical protein
MLVVGSDEADPPSVEVKIKSSVEVKVDRPSVEVKVKPPVEVTTIPVVGGDEESSIVDVSAK